MPPSPESNAVRPEESITQNTPDSQERVRHDAPEEIVKRLGPDARQYLLEQVVTIVQDQIALQRHFERNGSLTDVSVCKMNAFEQLVRFMRKAIPEIGDK